MYLANSAVTFHSLNHSRRTVDTTSLSIVMKDANELLHDSHILYKLHQIRLLATTLRKSQSHLEESVFPDKNLPLVGVHDARIDHDIKRLEDRRVRRSVGNSSLEGSILEMLSVNGENDCIADSVEVIHSRHTFNGLVV